MRTREHGRLSSQTVISEPRLRSSAQGGGPGPRVQPGLRLRLAGWVSLSPSQTGLDSTPDFPRELLERSAQSKFIHKRPCLPRSSAGLGQGQKGGISAKGVTSWLPQLPGVSPGASSQSLEVGPAVPGKGDRGHLQARSSGVGPAALQTQSCPAKQGHGDRTQEGHSFHFFLSDLPFCALWKSER